MTDINDHISYTYIEYNSFIHMKYKHLFVNSIYDYESADEYPLIITWAEVGMKVDEETGKALAVAAKTAYYPDSLKVSEDMFENMVQAFNLFPDNPNDDEDGSSKLRLEFARALLNK